MYAWTKKLEVFVDHCLPRFAVAFFFFLLSLYLHTYEARTEIYIDKHLARSIDSVLCTFGLHFKQAFTRRAPTSAAPFPAAGLGFRPAPALEEALAPFPPPACLFCIKAG